MTIFSKDNNNDLNALIQMASTAISVDGQQLSPSPTFKYLGINLDQHLTMKEHIAQATRTSMWQVREIRWVRRRLDRQTAEKLICCFVLSRLDYCNSIFHNLPNTTILPMARVLNAAARVISQTRLYDHITPVMIELHWLPLQQRMVFKQACIVFRCLEGSAPSYLSDTIRLVDSERLRATRTLQVPLRTCNSFSSNGSSIWNNLPATIRCPGLSFAAFKSKLKTFLFAQAYNR
jgi:hypothetical protein